MPTRPKFKSHLRVELMGDNGIALLSEREQYVLNGEAYPHLAPLLNGDHTVDEMIGLLGDKVSLPQFFYALKTLEINGHIVEADDSFSASWGAFWQTLGADPRHARERLAASIVALRSINGISVAPFADALSALGLTVVDRDDGDVLVVVTDDYDRPELDDINRRALETGQPWLLVKPIGMIAWIGPLFRPGTSACWQCLAQRVRSNRQLESYIQGRRAGNAPVVTAIASLPSTLSAIAQLVSTDIAKWLVLGSGDSSAVRTLDFGTLEVVRHVLHRRPQCFECGDVASFRPTREPEPVALTSRPKAFTGDGGHRICTPAQTFERLRDHISSITGVVSSLTRIDQNTDSELIFTYSAGHNFALVRNETYFLLRNIRGRSGGKGMSDTQARVSGLCEAIERYSGLFSGEEIRRRASYTDLTEAALFPPSYLLFSDAQIARRREWSHDNDSDFHMVPEKFDATRFVDWTPIWSLTNGGFRYVPSAYCYYGHPDIRERYDTACDSNGNAAGNVLEEAILQGFLELAERDAVAIWWYNRLRRPAVDLTSFDEPYIRALTEHYRTIGREFWVLDITNDLGIPTFAAVSRRFDKPVEDIVLGFGAHLDPRIALLRAVTEINQFMPAVSGTDPSGEVRYSFDDAEAIRWWKTATIANQPYITPDPNAASRTRDAFPRLSTSDLAADVNVCVRLAADRGLETFVLDQTRPDVGLSVVKVIVPGLRHFWKRFAPGRLYDVPVQLGWLDVSTPEADLNPIGIFF